MNFGEWLKEKRANARISGPDFERGGVSRQYISNLETGHVERPSREYAVKIAKVLKVDPDEALLAAGYAPNILPRSGPPQTLEELIEIAESLGIQNLQFFDHDKLRSATPEQLQEVLEAIEVAMSVTLARQMRTLTRNDDLRTNG